MKIKNSILILVFLSSFFSCVNDDEIRKIDVYLYNQKSVDDFKQTSITGDLVIGRGDVSIASNITNLDSLENLTDVYGKMRISNNPMLTSLKGLDNLTFLGALEITKNDSLISLEGLGNLRSVRVNDGAREFSINNNLRLTSLKGLNSLTFVEEIKVENNNSLISLSSGFNKITSVGNIYIEGNDSLISLNSFNELNSVGDDVYIGLRIYGNKNLEYLNAFDKLTSVKGNLTIGDNPKLISLDDFENLKSVKGELSIYNNNAITSLEGLSNISYVESYIDIHANDNLTNFCDIKELILKAPKNFNRDSPILVSYERMLNEDCSR